jgi:hypothetical protein
MATNTIELERNRDKINECERLRAAFRLPAIWQAVGRWEIGSIASPTN